jgi:hypothetical protein
MRLYLWKPEPLSSFSHVILQLRAHEALFVEAMHIKAWQKNWRQTHAMESWMIGATDVAEQLAIQYYKWVRELANNQIMTEMEDLYKDQVAHSTKEPFLTDSDEDEEDAIERSDGGKGTGFMPREQFLERFLEETKKPQFRERFLEQTEKREAARDGVGVLESVSLLSTKEPVLIDFHEDDEDAIESSDDGKGTGFMPREQFLERFLEEIKKPQFRERFFEQTKKREAAGGGVGVPESVSPPRTKKLKVGSGMMTADP